MLRILGRIDESNCIENETPLPPNLQYTTLTLKGPFSPLESNLFSTCCYTSRLVKIDQASVNSVLLNADPQVHFVKFKFFILN